MFFEACGLRFRVVCSERTHRRVNGPWGSSFDSWWAVLELEKSQHDSCSIISIVEAAKSGCQDDQDSQSDSQDGDSQHREPLESPDERPLGMARPQSAEQIERPDMLAFEVGGQEVCSARSLPRQSIHCRLPGGVRFVVHETPEGSDKRLEQEGIAAAFRLCDRNGDGSLTREEVLQACGSSERVRLLLGLPRTLATEEDRERFDQMFEDLDADGSGTVDVAEFLRVFADPSSEVEAGRIRLAQVLVAMGHGCAAPHADLLVDILASTASKGAIPGTFVKQ